MQTNLNNEMRQQFKQAIIADDLETISKLCKRCPGLKTAVFEALEDTPLMLAIECDADAVFEFLLAQKPNLNKQNREGDTALSIAARLQKEAHAKRLLEQGANPCVENQHALSALVIWLCQGRGPLVYHFLQKIADKSFRYPDSDLVAALINCPKLKQHLIQSANKRIVAKAQRAPQATDELVNGYDERWEGPNADLLPWYQEVLALEAVAWASPDLLDYAVQRKLSLDDGVLIAAATGNIATLDYLMGKYNMGINAAYRLSDKAANYLGTRDFGGNSFSLLQIATLFNQSVMVHKLMQAGAEILFSTKNLTTPLLIAAQLSNLSILEGMFIQKGARLSTADLESVLPILLLRGKKYAIDKIGSLLPKPLKKQWFSLLVKEEEKTRINASVQKINPKS